MRYICIAFNNHTNKIDRIKKPNLQYEIFVLLSTTTRIYILKGKATQTCNVLYMCIVCNKNKIKQNKPAL